MGCDGLIREGGCFDTISMGFFFHCIVLQISIRFEMTFLIKRTKREKNKLVNCGPRCLRNDHRLIRIKITFSFPLGGKTVLNLSCTTCFVTIKLNVYTCVGLKLNGLRKLVRCCQLEKDLGIRRLGAMSSNRLSVIRATNVRSELSNLLSGTVRGHSLGWKPHPAEDSRAVKELPVSG